MNCRDTCDNTLPSQMFILSYYKSDYQKSQKILSSKLTWQLQFPLWLHLLSTTQSYVVSGILHKAFIFFLFSSEYQMALRSHYFFQLILFWRIFLYKYLRDVSHYNPVMVFWVFFPSNSYFLSITWLLCYSFSAKMHNSATPDHLLFLDNSWDQHFRAGFWCCWSCITWYQKGFERSTPPRARITATSQGCSSSPSRPVSWTHRWAWPLMLMAHRAWGKDRSWHRIKYEQETSEEDTIARWMLTYSRKYPRGCAAYCCSSNVQKPLLFLKIIFLF